MTSAKIVIFTSLAITYVRCYPGYSWNKPNLNPVHGLYVKPSGDGATGDLFVAATEDSGMKSEWVVDKPVNYLPMASASHSHIATLPVPYPIFPTPTEESSTTKRSAMSSPASNPPVQYAYALPVSSSEGSSMPSFPYAYPVSSTPSENSATKCDQSSAAPQYPFQYPFQFFYPQMMSAYSNAMTILKDAGINEDTASSVMAQASPMWPPSPFTYPMYVMFNPSACAESYTITTPATSTSSPSEDGSTSS